MSDNHAHGRLTAPGELRFVRLLPGPIERIWRYLTDPDKRALWQGDGVTVPGVGGRMRIAFRNNDLTPHIEPVTPSHCHLFDENGDGPVVEGRITRWEPPRFLSYTWGESVGPESEVFFELTPQDDGQVRLVLTHRRLGNERGKLLSIAAGWHTHIGILLAVLAGDVPPPFWSIHARLERDYEALLAQTATTWT
jgi:uncharacterized protein YndB with AHSA1/START domain